jgi:hypothetical protein
MNWRMWSSKADDGGQARNTCLDVRLLGDAEAGEAYGQDAGSAPDDIGPGADGIEHAKEALATSNVANSVQNVGAALKLF